MSMTRSAAVRRSASGRRRAAFTPRLSHLAMFATDYLKLLGFREAAADPAAAVFNTTIVFSE